METNEIVPTLELNVPFVIDAKATIRGKKLDVSYTVNPPSHSDLEKRDAAQPYRSKAISEDEEEVLMSVSRQKDADLFDRLLVSTTGYKNNVTPELGPEERTKALRGIPTAHKLSIIKDLTTVNSEIVYSDDEDITAFEWTENQEYRVRTEIGTNARFVIYSTVGEPSERQLEKFTGATRYVLEKGQRGKPVTRISVELTPAVELFDAKVNSLENVSFDGNPVDVKNVEQLEKLSSYVKRSIISTVIKETSLDMGE